MRISDWSSDVCSSDLQDQVLTPLGLWLIQKERTCSLIRPRNIDIARNGLNTGAGRMEPRISRILSEMEQRWHKEQTEQARISRDEAYARVDEFQIGRAHV